MNFIYLELENNNLSQFSWENVVFYWRWSQLLTKDWSMLPPIPKYFFDLDDLIMITFNAIGTYCGKGSCGCDYSRYLKVLFEMTRLNQTYHFFFRYKNAEFSNYQFLQIFFPSFPEYKWKESISVLGRENWYGWFKLTIEKYHSDFYSTLMKFQKKQADIDIIAAKLSLGRSLKQLPNKKWLASRTKSKLRLQIMTHVKESFAHLLYAYWRWTIIRELRFRLTFPFLIANFSIYF